MQHTDTSTQAAASESTRLANFALSMTLANIPDDVLTKAKEHLLDALGSAIASSGFDFGRAALQGATALGQGTEASALGSGTRLPAPSAALVNGILAHGLDFDDTHIGAIYHASAQALAAALAAGQANNSNGAEVLLAFTAALEIGCRLASVGAPGFHQRGFHPTALCGTFAAAIAAGRLYGTSVATLVSALGLCGSQAAGILEIGNSWLKRLHPGWAAHSGLAAVALARAGFLGPDTVFEGHKGFYATHLESVPQGDQLPSYQLGETWQTRGIGLKPYPCCHFIHAFVDAALELRDQFHIDEIERIELPLTADLHKLVAEPRHVRVRPTNPYQALFSVQFVVAQALARGRVELAVFHDEQLDKADVLAVADKIWCVPDPLSDFPRRFPGELIVTLKNGMELRSRKSASLGSPDAPLTREAIIAKFVANASRVIRVEAARELATLVLDLESAPSLERIMALSVPD